MSTEPTIVWPNPDDVPSRTWFRGDLFTGVPGTGGKYVPKVNDAVYEFLPQFTMYRVIAVSISGVATLQAIDTDAGSDGVSNEDALLGAGPGGLSESFRCVINTQQIPFRMELDPRMRTYSPTASHYKVFRGTDISESGEVISAWYNSSGQLVSENIDMVLVATDNITNQSVKTFKVGYCSKQMTDNEVVSVVVYDDNGIAVRVGKLLVQLSNNVRSSTAETKYVTSIRLESTFLSNANEDLLEYYENVTIDSAQLFGVVSYSDGTSATYPVDGTKFKLHGKDAYIPTTPGQEQPVTLLYVLSANESTNISVTSANGVVMRPYRIRTLPADGAYSVKLFVYPSWINSVQGYRLEYWLYNLDRDQYYYATPYVEMAVNSAPFLPTQYGVNQTLAVAIDLNRVNPNFKAHRHVQTFTITLHRRGDILTIPNWTIGYNVGEPNPYGLTLAAKLKFINTNQWQMTLSSGAASMEDWLNKVYLQTKPMYNPDQESQPPIPTHFNVIFKSRTYEYTVQQWNAVNTVINDYVQGELVKLQFFRRTASDDLQLGMSAMIVHVS